MQAVIITPTRELAIQISEEARKFCTGTEVKTAILYGGTDVRFQRGQLARGCNILVATPGRSVVECTLECPGWSDTYN